MLMPLPPRAGGLIRLVFVDVDGTLVGSGSRIHPSVWPAADHARAVGVRLSLCSGRPGFGVSRSYAERLDPAGWHIFQNGASIVHLPIGASRSMHFAPDVVTSLIARARATGRQLELYTDTDYVVEQTSDRARAHALLLGVPFNPRPFESLAGPFVRAQWVVPLDQAPAIDAEPHPGLEMSSSTSPVMPDTQFMNMTPDGVSKAAAVRAVAAGYGVPLDEVMFVGDGWNDIDAMRIIGHPVAMANAEPEVRTVARTMVADVDDGGLAQALALAAGAGVGAGAGAARI